MQAIRQLDEDDADVFRHRQGHFLKVLGLAELHRVKLHVGQFADPIDQFRHLLAELGTNVFLVDARVLDHIVQQRGHQALRVHTHASENAGHRQRMSDVGLSTAPCLAVVSLLGVIVCAPHQLRLVQRQVIGDQLLKGRQ